MALKIYFLSHWLWKHRVPALPNLLTFLNRIIFATHIPPSVIMGRDVQLSYYGLGTIIHHRAVIGNRVLVGAGTVIGGRSGHEAVPVIEDDVDIGVGAKILGPIKVGKGAIIGANAVVIHDVPAGAVVGGVPARELRKRVSTLLENAA
jgi:serine O-acetyltransferase